MVANVYLDVVDICLRNHANNPRLGEFLRIFYGTVVEDMILLSGTNQSTGATNVLQFDLKLRAMSIVLNHFCTFTKGTDATINLAQKEQRDKFESAVIKVIESAVSVSSDTLCDDSQNGTQTVGNNFASTDPAEPISTDHTLYSMHTFIATLSLFMKDTLAESRSVVASPPGKRTMFENVGLITNINDAIHKAVHKLEEMERDSYDMGSTDRHVERGET